MHEEAWNAYPYCRTIINVYLVKSSGSYKSRDQFDIFYFHTSKIKYL